MACESYSSRLANTDTTQLGWSPYKILTPLDRHKEHELLLSWIITFSFSQ
jgi:hypothetical protein